MVADPGMNSVPFTLPKNQELWILLTLQPFDPIPGRGSISQDLVLVVQLILPLLQSMPEKRTLHLFG